MMLRPNNAWRYAACLCVLTLALAGCTGLPPGSSPVAPILHEAFLARSAGSQTDLLYTGVHQRVAVYTYPDGTLADTFKTPFSIQAMCSDAKGNVFITAEVQRKQDAGIGYVYEYAHGGTSPVATLDLPSHQIPVNCSSDAATENLAVTSYDIRNYAPLVEIYGGGSGNPELFHSRELGTNPQPAYDPSGNLFVISGGNVAALLRKGNQRFEKITLNETIGNVAHAQWDGKYFALQSYAPTKHNREKIFVHYYRIQISGATGAIVGISHFHNWLQGNPGQSWIQNDTLVATLNKSINFWKYPAGGQAYKVLRPSPGQAMTVSAAR
jgi:hypothetical protein